MSDRRAVFVTGASSGIGEATAGRLAARGFHLFGGYRRVESAKQLEASGIEPIALDITDPAQVEAARKAIESRLGGRRLWGLVQSAGVAGAGPAELTPVEEYRRVMEVNFFGAVGIVQSFLPLLRAGRGRIVLISSLSGRVSMPFMSPYCASKFALEAFGDGLRRELHQEGIEVVLIEPGPVRTPMWDRVEELDPTPFRGTRYEDRLARFRDAALVSGRRGLPAAAVARTVERVLTRPRPPSRVVVTTLSGRAKVRLVRWLPDRLADRLIVSARG